MIRMWGVQVAVGAGPRLASGVGELVKVEKTLVQKVPGGEGGKRTETELTARQSPDGGTLAPWCPGSCRGRIW